MEQKLNPSKLGNAKHDHFESPNVLFITLSNANCCFDMLYTVAVVYGTKSLCDLCVLLSLDRMIDSDSGISTKLCLS